MPKRGGGGGKRRALHRRVVFINIDTEQQVEAILAEVKKFPEQPNGYYREQEWHIFFFPRRGDGFAGEKAKDALKERLAASFVTGKKMRSSIIDHTIASKESGGRLQDDLISSVALNMWGHTDKILANRQPRLDLTLDFHILIQDPDRALLVHVEDMLDEAAEILQPPPADATPAQPAGAAGDASPAEEPGAAAPEAAPESAAAAAAVIPKKPSPMQFTFYSDVEMPKEEPLLDPAVSGHPGAVTWRTVELEKEEQVLQECQKANPEISEMLCFQYKDDILRAIQAHKVVVLMGPTGCGKSSIIPMLIRTNQRLNNIAGKVIVAQPRRLPVVTLCSRVQELTEKMGGVLHAETQYRIGTDDRTTPRTTLEFTTYGCLVRLLHRNPTLEGYTHVFLDEIHERQLDMDFVVGMLLPAVTSNTRKEALKIVLMSATCSVKPFRDHFVGPSAEEGDTADEAELKRQELGRFARVDPSEFHVVVLENAEDTAEREKFSVEVKPDTCVRPSGQKRPHKVEVHYLETRLLERLRKESPPAAWTDLTPVVTPGLELQGAVARVAAKAAKPLYYVKRNRGQATESLALVDSFEAHCSEPKVPISGTTADEMELKTVDRDATEAYQAILKEEAREFASAFLVNGPAGVHAVLDDLKVTQMLRLGRQVAHAPSCGREHVPNAEDDIRALSLPALHSALSFYAEKLLTHDERVRIAAEIVKKKIFVCMRKPQNSGKNILIFLPGLRQIQYTERELQLPGKWRRPDNGEVPRFSVHILHSQMPLSEQQKVQDGKDEVKVILATNTAESSVTINDVGVVIDCCLGRFEKEDNIVITERSSRDAAKQRAGRTGRTADGEVYRIITKAEWELMQEYRDPEIFARGLPDPLRLILSARSYANEEGVYSPLEVMQRSIFRSVSEKKGGRDQLIEEAANALVYQGAISKVAAEGCGDGGNRVTYKLTRLGKLQALLPISWQWAHFMYIGCKLGIAQECATVAALLSSRAVLYEPSTGDGQLMFLELCSGTYSDPVACVELMSLYLHESAKGLEGDDLWLSQSNTPGSGVRLSCVGLAQAHQSAEDILACMDRFLGRGAVNVLRVKERKSLDGGEKRLLLLAWAAAFQGNACKFIPSVQQKTRRLNTVRFPAGDAEKRARSIVVVLGKESRRDAVERMLKCIGVDQEAVVMRPLQDEDWTHGECPRLRGAAAQGDLEFRLITLPPREDTPLAFGLDASVWLAEKYSHKNDLIEVMSCVRWRTHSDMDRWVPFGSTHICDGASVGAKVELMSMSSPLLAEEDMLVFPSVISEFRKSVEDRVLTARHAAMLPHHNELLVMLSCLMVRTEVSRAFCCIQEYAQIDDLPADWETVLVARHAVPCAPDSWLRSKEFRRLREHLMCRVDDATLNHVTASTLRECLLSLAESAGCRDVLSVFDTEAHESSQKRLTARRMKNDPDAGNIDYSRCPQEFSAEFNLPNDDIAAICGAA
eukprot:TRINITY_DN3361_c0_g1_i1.p1 TRINITY_DN3361_c0_g1~~TRINITY_DN3361_c0_g1_i1.p1  ORF type:complete len:1494 (+),score=535.04 TRINITY_DN3361_c0_g1_i1:80-4483(+)